VPSTPFAIDGIIWEDRCEWELWNWNSGHTFREAGSR